MDQRIGRTIAQWTGHQQSVVKIYGMRSVDERRYLTVGLDRMAFLWSSSSSIHTSPYMAYSPPSLALSMFDPPMHHGLVERGKKLRAWSGLPEAQGGMTPSTIALWSSTCSFNSSPLNPYTQHHGDVSVANEYINVGQQQSRDQQNAISFMAFSGHKGSMVHQPFSLPPPSSTPIMKSSKLYFSDDTGEKLTRNNISIGSLAVMKMKKLVLVGCSDGYLRIST